MVINYNCEECGRPGKRVYSATTVPEHIFCSVGCYAEWQKKYGSRTKRNKDPSFRKKVSEGLKRRKRVLGENYHSPETKRKIGKTTVQHWNEYDDETRSHMLDVLYQNAQEKRKHGPYDVDWKRKSRKMRSENVCRGCGATEDLTVHHIIPVKQGGDRSPENLVTLCRSCHSKIEWEQKRMFKEMQDWNKVQDAVREELQCV